MNFNKMHDIQNYLGVYGGIPGEYSHLSHSTPSNDPSSTCQYIWYTDNNHFSLFTKTEDTAYTKPISVIYNSREQSENLKLHQKTALLEEYIPLSL